MTRGTLAGIACAALLWAGPALGASAEDKCRQQRMQAWGTYLRCEQDVAARIEGGQVFDDRKALWKCRHKYFANWTRFQSKAALAGSSCRGARFTDNGTTTTDNLSGLVWEQKTDDDTEHDKDNGYSWTTASPWLGNGTVFTSFLQTLNTGAGFAGANDWRLPTRAEVQTILTDFECKGKGGDPGCRCAWPCIAYDPQYPTYAAWSSTTLLSDTEYAYVQDFTVGQWVVNLKTSSLNQHVIAVRGGL